MSEPTTDEILAGITAERVGAVVAAHKIARDTFDSWAGLEPHALPLDPLQAMQVRLWRWRTELFGETTDERIALGVIEELHETFVADDPEKAIDGLGDTMVYAGHLAYRNRLAIGPILDLARVFTRRQDVEPMRAQGELAHVVLKHAEKIRGLGNDATYRLRLVDTLALCVAKAIDDCEIGHTLQIRAGGVYQVIGEEVMRRRAGDVMIPAIVPADLIFEQVASAAGPGVITYRTPAGDVQVSKLAEVTEDGVPFTRVRIGSVTPAPPDLDAAIALSAQARALREQKGLEGLERGVDALQEAEQLEGSGDFDVSDVVNHARICPQCGAGLLSEGRASDVWRCENGHDITGMQLAAARLPIPRPR